jgi:hypothetical protein
MDEDFTATPTTNTKFVVFAPLYKEIKHAQCEQAISLVETSGIKTSLQNYRDLSAEAISIGEISVRFGSNSGSGTSMQISLSPLARKLLSRFIRKTIRIGRG